MNLNNQLPINLKRWNEKLQRKTRLTSGGKPQNLRKLRNLQIHKLSGNLIEVPYNSDLLQVTKPTPLQAQVEEREQLQRNPSQLQLRRSTQALEGRLPKGGEDPL